MDKNKQKHNSYLSIIRDRQPSAVADIIGGPLAPRLYGKVGFFVTPLGVLVAAEIWGLPKGDRPCGGGVFGFHIHEGESCTGNVSDPFANTGGHYNPSGCPHPFHAGDLPPLFGNNGYAWCATITDRFKIEDIIGKTVVVHSSPDDFTSQPAGNSGEKIACGEIYIPRP